MCAKEILCQYVTQTCCKGFFHVCKRNIMPICYSNLLQRFLSCVQKQYGVGVDYIRFNFLSCFLSSPGFPCDHLLKIHFSPRFSRFSRIVTSGNKYSKIILSILLPIIIRSVCVRARACDTFTFRRNNFCYYSTKCPFFLTGN